MTVVKFPGRADAPNLLIGPFQRWKVQVDGRVIPRLTGYPQDDGRVTLIVDERFAADFPPDLARQAAWLIAEAMAIGEGYPSANAATRDRPFAPVGMQITPTDGLLSGQDGPVGDPGITPSPSVTPSPPPTGGNLKEQLDE